MFIEQQRSAPVPMEPWSLLSADVFSDVQFRSNITESAVKYEPSIHHIIMQNIHI